MSDHATYQTRIDSESVFYGECHVCGEIISVKKGTRNVEWFCHMCGGARHFCEDPQCYHLLEVFYSRCENEDHKRIEIIWAPDW